MTTTPTHVYFYSDGTIFSNWHRTLNQFTDPINDNLVFHSTEQAFMWQKAMFFWDHRVAGLVEKNPSPAFCKKLGREIVKYDDNAWRCARLGFMTYVNYLKYSQNPAFAKELLDTGNRILVEASPSDRIWGIGISEEEAARGEPWRGYNLLGIALMNVRGLIRGDKKMETSAL